MSTPASTIHSRIAATVEAVATWRESRWAGGVFGSDPQPEMHHSFAVEVTATDIDNSNQRQRLSEPAVCESTVEVRWAHRLKVGDQVGDYRDALDAEADVYKAIMAASKSGGMRTLLVRLARDTRTQGWVLGTATFRIIHQIPLQ